MKASVPLALRNQLGGLATGALEAHLEEYAQEVETDVLSMAGERFERRLAEELGALRCEFHRDLQAIRVDLLKWSFLFWVGQLGALAGVIAVLT
jgi:hypothetical protein